MNVALCPKLAREGIVEPFRNAGPTCAACDLEPCYYADESCEDEMWLVEMKGGCNVPLWLPDHESGQTMAELIECAKSLGLDMQSVVNTLKVKYGRPVVIGTSKVVK